MAKHAGGRPSIFTQKLADLICTRIARGEALRAICRDEGMPDISSVIAWRNAKPEFSSQYEKAREDQADSLADEIQDIADNSTNDFIEKFIKGGGKMIVPDMEHIQRSRLRVDTRKWIASKLKPKRYGEKVQTEHSGSIEMVSDRLKKARERIAKSGHTDSH